MRVSLFWRLGLTYLALVLAVFAGIYWSSAAGVSSDAAAAVRHSLWLAAAGIFVITAAVSFTFSLLFSSRINRVKRFAQRAAAGDFTPLQRAAAVDELADLADAVGGMVAQLGQTIHTLTDERNQSAAEPLHVRVGLNAGEPIEEDGDLFGATIILAARLAAAAGSGEILASMAVRELSAGKPFLFADRGDRALRGFEDPVRIFEVNWRG